MKYLVSTFFLLFTVLSSVLALVPQPPVINKIYPASDTIVSYDDSVVVGAHVTISSGTIDEVSYYAIVDFVDIEGAHEETNVLPSQDGDVYYFKKAFDIAMDMKIVIFAVGNGDTTFSDTVEVTIGCGTVTPPTASSATDVDVTSFRANWSAVPEAVSYELTLWKESLGADSSTVVEYILLSEDLGDVTDYEINLLEASTTYKYSVAAITGYGCESALSNTIEVTTDEEIIVDTDEKVAEQTAVFVAEGKITITAEGLQTVTIVDIAGRPVVEELINNNSVISVPGGMYLVKVAGKIFKVVVP